MLSITPSHISHSHLSYRPQVFYATIGASANVALVLHTAPILFAYSFVAIAGHLGLLLAVGTALGFSRRDLLLASNANIGGEGAGTSERYKAGEWGHQMAGAALSGGHLGGGGGAEWDSTEGGNPYTPLLSAGPSTVAGMAAAKGWSSSLVPSILTSTLGYALGTFVGMGLGQGLLRRLG